MFLLLYTSCKADLTETGGQDIMVTRTWNKYESKRERQKIVEV